jgi:outer membrane beta-barrel protein
VRQTNLRFKLCFFALAMCLSAFSRLYAQTTSQSYRKASEGDDVVKNKLFPKKGKVEINGLNVGAILNQSYVNTILFHGGVSYFANEEWGFGIEGLFASNQDNSARYCIEHFYNDPKSEVGAQCDKVPGHEGESFPSGSKANYGPAYVPIREVKYAIAATAIWNPVYGKQLFFLSGTGYFDLFVTMGAGMVFSDFYPEKTTLNNGKPSRGNFPADGSGGVEPGATVSETSSYGVDGRPVPEQASDFMLTTWVCQKYHFADRFNLKVELRNYLLLGTSSGFDIFFALWGGVGMRL